MNPTGPRTIAGTHASKSAVFSLGIAAGRGRQADDDGPLPIVGLVEVGDVGDRRLDVALQRAGVRDREPSHLLPPGADRVDDPRRL
jgi:hypothetical protein